MYLIYIVCTFVYMYSVACARLPKVCAPDEPGASLDLSIYYVHICVSISFIV